MKRRGLGSGLTLRLGQRLAPFTLCLHHDQQRHRAHRRQQQSGELRDQGYHDDRDGGLCIHRVIGVCRAHIEGSERAEGDCGQEDAVVGWHPVVMRHAERGSCICRCKVEGAVLARDDGTSPVPHGHAQRVGRSGNQVVVRGCIPYDFDVVVADLGDVHHEHRSFIDQDSRKRWVWVPVHGDAHRTLERERLRCLVVGVLQVVGAAIWMTLPATISPLVTAPAISSILDAPRMSDPDLIGSLANTDVDEDDRCTCNSLRPYHGSCH